jgi:uncharacterized protein (DUF433 family)
MKFPTSSGGGNRSGPTPEGIWGIDFIATTGRGQPNATHTRIAVNPAVCHGHPVIAGTRIIVSQLLGALAGGQTFEELLEDYPSLKSEDINTALAFASDLPVFNEPSPTPPRS